MIVGIKECADTLAMKRGITKSEALSIMKDVVDVVCEKCIEDDGVSFKGKFTIKKKIQKGRSGKCGFNDTEWKTEDKYSLAIKVGNDLDFDLNHNK